MRPGTPEQAVPPPPKGLLDAADAAKAPLAVNRVGAMMTPFFVRKNGQAVTNFDDPKVLGEISKGLGEAMKGIGGAIVGVTAVICAVFVPIAFLGGVTGTLYKQFAITITISTLLSAITALTLTPALCALILKQGMHKPKPIQAFDRFFERVTERYVAGVGGSTVHNTNLCKRTPEPITNLTPDVKVQNLRGIFHLRNGVWREDFYGPLYADPYPLSDKFFLVSCNPAGRYNDRAEEIVGRRMLNETAADPRRQWPEIRWLRDIFREAAAGQAVDPTGKQIPRQPSRPAPDDND